ncbi:MAG: hypothetical protein ABL959_12350 [Pyrinomonadaceae bacterium]
MKIFRYLTALVILYSVVLLTACPQASLQKAKDSSARVATYANAGVNLTRNLYTSKLITLSQKDLVARKFVQLAEAGIAFDAVLAKAVVVYGSNVPKSEIAKAFETFDSEVVGKFLDILESLKVIANKSAYAQIIEGLRTAVLIVANVFGHRQSVARRITAVA